MGDATASARASPSACGSTTRMGSPTPAATSMRSRRRPGAPTWSSRRSSSTARSCRRLGDRRHDRLRRARRDRPRASSTPLGSATLEALDASLRPAARSLGRTSPTTPAAVADGILHAEVRRLARDSRSRCAGRAAPETGVDALAELLACFPGVPQLPTVRARAPRRARSQRRRHASPRPRPHPRADSSRARAIPRHPAAIRFQQTSGMVMAKGVEDTAFYRDSRLATLTEVGGDPGPVRDVGRRVPRGSGGPARHPPDGMTTLTTHDTKRGEDTRARISVLAELPGEWAAFIGRRRRRACATARSRTCSGSRSSACWPREREALHGYVDQGGSRSRRARRPGRIPTPRSRIALRRSGRHRLRRPGDRAPTSRRSSPASRTPGWSNALGAKLLQLTGARRARRVPGNRALGLLARRPRQPASGRLRPAPPDAGRPRCGSRRRSTRPALPSCSSHPEPCAPVVTGPSCSPATPRCRRRARPPATSSLADRGGAISVATRLPVRLSATGGWRGTTIALPDRPYRDALTGERLRGRRVRGADVLSRYPGRAAAAATDRSPNIT